MKNHRVARLRGDNTKDNKAISGLQLLWPGHSTTPPSQQLDPHQVEAFDFAMSRQNSYLALEQGTGKTPLAVAIINRVKSTDSRPALIIVPPFLVTNWVREIEAWQTTNYKLKLVLTRKGFLADSRTNIYIVADSILISPKVQDDLRWVDFSVIAVDEAQRFSNFSAKRTKALFGNVTRRPGSKIILLSGTPMLNRPRELYPALSALAPETIDNMDYFRFGLKFCNGHKVQVTRHRWVWNFEGVSNPKSLARRIHGTFMLRISSDVLKLKPKVERAVILDGKRTATVTRLEKLITQKKSIEEIIGSASIGDIASYRKELVRLKLKPASLYINEAMTSGKSLIVFCWHTEMAMGLSLMLKEHSPLVITGQTPMGQRDKIQNDFQNGKSKLLIANIATMVGLNLTVATHAIFAESMWSPKANEQATFRIYRRGQSESVLIEHLVLANTLDHYVIARVLQKNKTINTIIDRG